MVNALINKKSMKTRHDEGILIVKQSDNIKTQHILYPLQVVPKNLRTNIIHIPNCNNFYNSNQSLKSPLQLTFLPTIINKNTQYIGR